MTSTPTRKLPTSCYFRREDTGAIAYPSGARTPEAAYVAAYRPY